MSSERCGSMSIRSALRSTSTIHQTKRSASCSSLRRALAARSRSVTDSPPRRLDHFGPRWQQLGAPGTRLPQGVIVFSAIDHRAKGFSMATVTFRKVDVDGIKVFYREAGPKDAPTILLLHGFPTAGHMFRDLIPQLADRFRLIAPDLPAFGQSDMPARSAFSYSFEKLADVIGRFTEVIGLDRFAIYVFDYGAPVGFRLAVRHPDRITALISQNGNAYEEGLSAGWNPIRAYWQDASE